jgi:phosphatidylglycerol:prolipoprotein diacylglycerol transferase
VRTGEVFIGYLIWYSIGRFFIEGLRTDSLAYQGTGWVESIIGTLWSPMQIVFEPGYLDPNYGNVRVSQLVAIFLIVVGIALIATRRVTCTSKALYRDPIVSTKAAMVIEAAGDSANDAGSNTETEAPAQLQSVGEAPSSRKGAEEQSESVEPLAATEE